MSDWNSANADPGQEYTLGSDESPSAGVWSVIAALEDCSPLELPPLTAATDPDALDTLLANSNGSEHVSFDYYGYAVTVTSDTVCVRPRDDSAKR